MSKELSGQLYRVIKSLKTEEKRYYKLSSSMYASGKNSNYNKVFDFISRQDACDDDMIKKQFEGADFLRHFRVFRSRLLNAVMDSLEQLHSSVDIDFRKMLSRAEILFEKGLYRDSINILDRVIYEAGKMERLLFVIEAIYWKKKINITINYSLITEKEFIQLIRLEEESIQKVQNETMLQNLQSRIFFNNSPVPGDIKDFEKNKKILEHPLLKSEDTALTVRGKFIFNNINMVLLFSKGDFQNGYHFSKRNVVLMESHPDIIVANPGNYIISLFNCTLALLNLGKITEVEQYVKKANQLFDMYPVKRTFKLETELFLYSSTSLMNVYINTGLFERSVPTMLEIEGKMKIYGAKLSVIQRITLYYMMAYAYFGIGNYKSSLFYLNKVLNSKNIKQRNDLIACSFILRLLVHFELGNKETLSYFGRSAKRYILKTGIMQEESMMVIKEIERFNTIDDKTEIKKSFSELRKKLNTIRKTPTQEAADPFPVKAWVESKVTGVSLPEIIKRRK